MTAIMGKFEEEEKHDSEAIDEEDKVGGWEARMMVVYTRLPYRDDAKDQEVWEDSDALLFLLTCL